MKLEDFQKIPQGMEQCLEVFNALVLRTKKGNLIFAKEVLEKVKWLFVMPLPLFEQLIANMELVETNGEADEKAKDEIVALLKAVIPVKQLLDEQWKDLEISV